MYPSMGPSMGPSLSSGSVSFFRPPMLEPLRAVRRSTTLESPHGIHDSIVGLFAPVLRSTESYEEDCLVKAAPR